MSEQVHTTSSTPVSRDSSAPAPAPAAATSATKALKDRSCPFCRTPYTASSLGRHLDTYIKPKNPKPPDGIHDVDKIREMRQGITRRHMREKVNSKRAFSTSQTRTPSWEAARPLASGDGDGDGDEDMEDEEDEDSASPLTTGPMQPLNIIQNGEKVGWRVNELSWHDTGVMRDLPARPPSTLLNGRRDVSRHHTLKAELESRQRLSDEAERAMAAEMALKEVLGRVKEASARSVQAGIFDFDPFELNFPALCLKTLAAPPTLRSPTPFPTNESWSLSPPGQRQWESLQRAVKERVIIHQRAVGGMFISSGLPTPPLLDMDLSRLKTHLHDAYMHWQSLSDIQKQETWQLEILRLFSTAEEGRSNLQNKLDLAVKENEDLRRDLEQMRQMLEDDGVERGRRAPPVLSVPSIASKTVQELWKLGFDAQQWEYEPLVEKWKKAMREQKQSSNGLAAQQTLSAAPAVRVTSKADKAAARSRNARVEALASAAGVNNRRSASRSRTRESADQGDSGILPQEEAVDMTERDPPRQFASMQEQVVHSASERSPRPPTPQMSAHLSARAEFRDQRRSSAQFSPHSMPVQQQRRHSAQYPMPSQPLPQQHQSPPESIPPSTQGQLLQYPQASLLHMSQENAEPTSAVQSSFAAQSLQQPSMQGWIPHAQEHVPVPVQALAPASTPMPDQAHFNQSSITGASFQGLSLQVPPTDGRRNSHPMINAAQHMDMQGVDAPASAGPYMTSRMPGMDGNFMAYVGPNMGLVNGAGGSLG